ncbi:hypothetical protein ID866_11567, partial [Astraeus odoratus]
EVSTCEIKVNPGDPLNKGDLLGYFHFGGSTHLLIFGPHLRLTPLAEAVCDSSTQENRSLEGLKLQVGKRFLYAELRNQN